MEADFALEKIDVFRHDQRHPLATLFAECRDQRSRSRREVLDQDIDCARRWSIRNAHRIAVLPQRRAEKINLLTNTMKWMIEDPEPHWYHRGYGAPLHECQILSLASRCLMAAAVL